MFDSLRSDMVAASSARIKPNTYNQTNQAWKGRYAYLFKTTPTTLTQIHFSKLQRIHHSFAAIYVQIYTCLFVQI